MSHSSSLQTRYLWNIWYCNSWLCSN